MVCVVTSIFSLNLETSADIVVMFCVSAERGVVGEYCLEQMMFHTWYQGTNTNAYDGSREDEQIVLKS